MRRTILALALFVTSAARADDATAIVDRWAAAIGGIEKLRAVDTIHRIADSRDDGTPGTRDEWITRALARRELLEHTSDQTLETFDGTTAWRRDWNGFVERLDGVDVKREIDFAILHGFGALTGSAGRAELVSDGVVRFHPPGGLPLTYVIDKESGLPLRAEMPSFDGTMTIAFAGWRDVAGIRIPFVETQETGPSKSELHVRSIDLQPAERVAFTRPESGPNDTFFLRKERSERVPFNFDNNHIMILVTVNDVGPIWFLVDTGAEFSIINQSRLDEFHVKPYGGLQTIGGGESATGGAYAENVTYRIGDVELRNQHAAVIELRGLEKLYGMPLGGLLGFDFLSRFVIAIDYAHKSLTLYDRAHSTAGERGARVRLVMQGEQPYLDGSIRVGDETISCWFILDVGAADTITFTTPFIAAHQLLDRIGDKSRTVQHVAAPDLAAFAPTNVRGLIDAVTLGTITLPHVPVNLSVAKNGAYTSAAFDGNIGETILSRFPLVVLDYGRGEMILEPGPETAKPMEERKSFGLTLIASGNDFTTF
ncbi:MAG: aspartyl protease family protein, partial [Thermoanaerobaculia bacterium]